MAPDARAALMKQARQLAQDRAPSTTLAHGTPGLGLHLGQGRRR
jgi:hypothetical protein